jgi:uncharacterized protein (TIGR02246 family)
MKILFAVLCLFLGACAGVQSADIAIRDATVVDVAGGVLVPDQTVLISGNRIVAVGPTDEVSIAPGTEVIEGAGGYVIPGLWDMHVHSVGAGDWHFPLFLAHGVTGVRDMNDKTGDVTLEATNSIRRRLAEGDLPGPPRFLGSGPSVEGYPPLAATNPVVVHTAEEARAVVDNLVDAGADFIKPYENLSREAYFAIMDQARRRGVPVDGHVPFRVTAEEAAAAGQRTAEHPDVMAAGCSADAEVVRERFAGVLSDFGKLSEIEQFLIQFRLLRAFYETRDPAACLTTIEAYLRHDVAVTMDLVAYHHVVHADEVLADTTRIRLVPQAVRRNWDELAAGEGFRQFQSVLRPNIPLELENARLLRDAGVTLLAATDVGVPFQVPGISLHVELERLVEAGLTPLEALQAATLNPARVLGLDDSLGTVQAGKLADLILLDANPLEDISNTQRIRTVIADGQLYRRTDLDELLGTGSSETETEVALADTVLTLAREWLDAWNELDADRMLQFYDEDLLYYWRGRPMTYEQFEAAVYEHIIPNESYSIEMTNPHVQVLGADAAVVAFNWRDKADPRNEAQAPRAAVSLIFERRGGEWKIAHIHESPVER